MVYSTLKQQKSISISQVLFLVTFWVEYFILPMAIKTFYIFEITRFALYFNFTLYNAYSSHQEIYFYISMLTLKLKSTMWKMNIIVHIHPNWFDDGTHTDTHKMNKIIQSEIYAMHNEEIYTYKCTSWTISSMQVKPIKKAHLWLMLWLMDGSDKNIKDYLTMCATNQTYLYLGMYVFKNAHALKYIIINLKYIILWF